MDKFRNCSSQVCFIDNRNRLIKYNPYTKQKTVVFQSKECIKKYYISDKDIIVSTARQDGINDVYWNGCYVCTNDKYLSFAKLCEDKILCTIGWYIYCYDYQGTLIRITSWEPYFI